MRDSNTSQPSASWGTAVLTLCLPLIWPIRVYLQNRRSSVFYDPLQDGELWSAIGVLALVAAAVFLPLWFYRRRRERETTGEVHDYTRAFARHANRVPNATPRSENSHPVEFELAVADVSVSACDKLAEALAKAGIRVLVEQAYIDNRQHTWGIGYSGSAGEGTRMRIWVHRDDLDKANPIIEREGSKSAC